MTRVRKWVVNNYQYDPMMLAQVAAIKIRRQCGSADPRNDFRKLVREQLYENLEPPKASSKITTMSGIVDLLRRGNTGH